MLGFWPVSLPLVLMVSVRWGWWSGQKENIGWAVITVAGGPRALRTFLQTTWSSFRLVQHVCRARVKRLTAVSHSGRETRGCVPTGLCLLLLSPSSFHPTFSFEMRYSFLSSFQSPRENCRVCFAQFTACKCLAAAIFVFLCRLVIRSQTAVSCWAGRAWASSSTHICALCGLEAVGRHTHLGARLWNWLLSNRFPLPHHEVGLSWGFLMSTRPSCKNKNKNKIVIL